MQDAGEDESDRHEPGENGNCHLVRAEMIRQEQRQNNLLCSWFGRVYVKLSVSCVGDARLKLVLESHLQK